MARLIPLILFLTLSVKVSGVILQSDEKLRALIFKPAEVKHEYTDESIKELNKILSRSKGNKAYKELIADLAELPHLNNCDDEDFMKIDSLQQSSKSQHSNLREYLFEQRISLTKRCDQKLSQELLKAIDSLDRRALDAITRLSFLVTTTKDAQNITRRPMFSMRTLVKSIYRLLRENEERIAGNQKISKEEVKSLLKSLVVLPCNSLSSEFTQIAHFYFRNILDKGTLRYCQDNSIDWISRADICHSISVDEETLENVLYEIIVRKSEMPDLYLYEIMDKMAIV